MTFRPKGSRALRAILTEAVTGTSRGTLLSYDLLAGKLDAGDGARGRTTVQQVVAQARPVLLRNYGVALVPVRGIGYRVAEPNEFTGIAQGHQTKADKAMTRALATVDHAPVDDMTPAERQRHQAYATVLHNLARRADHADARLNRIESVLFPQRTVVPGEIEHAS